MILALLLCLLSLARPPASQAAVAPSGLLCDLLEHPEETVITNTSPCFGWIYNPSSRNDAQSGYQIIVASSSARARAGTGDVWDSGWINKSASINVTYAGDPLRIGHHYYWRVRTKDSAGQASPFSTVQHFIIGSAKNLFAGRYPLRFVPATPVLLTNTAPGRWFVDFGQDAFGYATLHLKDGFAPMTARARFGEMAKGFGVSMPPPGSTVRYAETTFHVGSGKATHAIRPPAFSYPAGAIQPPPAYGDIIPFRYLELIGLPKTLRITDVRQLRLLSTFDTNAASFTSSSSALDEVWNLCRNTMQVLTFDGIYVDGDRERKPYESDAYIHQLSSYAVDREFTMPRYSLEYLLQNPTWPTEWKFHDIFMAWADYVQTGEASLLRRHYSELRADSFEWAAPGGALMKGFPNFPQKTNSDVVDWPACDRDGFIIGDGPNLNWTNSVNNALYYHGLRLMANIAAAIGRTNEAARYSTRSAQVYTAYNTAFWNDVAKCYMDGVGVDHASAHANFFPLAFGLVPPSRQPAVLSFLHSRIASHGGMPCSVYAAQYLLEALFTAGDADTAIGLITTNGPRGWLNMITLGSTLTTEAWNFRDKPNMDWNHAWGAAPGNLIARFILGLRPLVPGFGKVLIQPRLGTTLLYADGTIPTIRGPVSICVSNAPASFQMRLNIPGNVTATVMLPAAHATKAVAVVDGKMLSGALSNNWLVLKNIGAGRHVIELERTTTPPSPGFYAKQGAASFHESTAEPVVAHPAADPPDEGTSH